MRQKSTILAGICTLLWGIPLLAQSPNSSGGRIYWMLGGNRIDLQGFNARLESHGYSPFSEIFFP